MTEHDAGSVRRPPGRWIRPEDEFRRISVRFTSADTETNQDDNTRPADAEETRPTYDYPQENYHCLSHSRASFLGNRLIQQAA